MLLQKDSILDTLELTLIKLEQQLQEEDLHFKTLQERVDKLMETYFKAAKYYSDYDTKGPLTDRELTDRFRKVVDEYRELQKQHSPNPQVIDIMCMRMEDYNKKYNPYTAIKIITNRRIPEATVGSFLKYGANMRDISQKLANMFFDHYYEQIEGFNKNPVTK